jgi:hypothetical protein
VVNLSRGHIKMSREKIFIAIGCMSLLSAFAITYFSGEMNIYDLVLAATTLAEKGTLEETIQKLIVILSIFGGIFLIFGGITYFFQTETSESLRHIDNAQFENFDAIKRNQELMEKLIRSFMEELGMMQRKTMERISVLEKDMKEVKRMVK